MDTCLISISTFKSWTTGGTGKADIYLWSHIAKCLDEPTLLLNQAPSANQEEPSGNAFMPCGGVDSYFKVDFLTRDHEEFIRLVQEFFSMIARFEAFYWSRKETLLHLLVAALIDTLP